MKLHLEMSFVMLYIQLWSMPGARSTGETIAEVRLRGEEHWEISSGLFVSLFVCLFI